MNNPNQNKPAAVAPGTADKPQQAAMPQSSKPDGKGQSKPTADVAKPDLSVKPANSDCASEPKAAAPVTAPAPVAAVAEPKAV